MTTTTTVHVPAAEDTAVSVTTYGAGHPVLLLHGGAGPRSVADFARALADHQHARVLVPTHPGFDGTARADWLDDIPALARLYRAVLEQLDLVDVTVVGNSIGGWIAAELALLDSPRISSAVLVDAVGIDVPREGVADVFALTPGQIAELSYHDPQPYRVDPASLGDAQQAAMAANFATLRAYAGDMIDPTLLHRLAAITVPSLVAWGDSDRIVTPAYGRAYAAAIPGARFELIEDAGHLPQIERPDVLLRLVWTFADAHASATPSRA